MQKVCIVLCCVALCCVVLCCVVLCCVVLCCVVLCCVVLCCVVWLHCITHRISYCQLITIQDNSQHTLLLYSSIFLQHPHTHSNQREEHFRGTWATFLMCDVSNPVSTHASFDVVAGLRIRSWEQISKYSPRGTILSDLFYKGKWSLFLFWLVMFCFVLRCVVFFCCIIILNVIVWYAVILSVLTTVC